MKKLLSFCLILCLVFSFVGCKKNNDSENNNSENVVTSSSAVSSISSETETETESESSETSASSASSKVNNCIHNFTKATCKKLKTCKKCGETAGTLADHKWKDASCVSLKTCSVCGKIEGELGEHSFVKGVCTVCKEEDPDYGLLTSHLWQLFKSRRLIGISFSNEVYSEAIMKPYSELSSEQKASIDAAGEEADVYVSGGTKWLATDGDSFKISFKEEKGVVTVAVTEGPDHTENGKWIVFKRIGKTKLKVTKCELKGKFWKLDVGDVLTIAE